jgi:hypothetical protein
MQTHQAEQNFVTARTAHSHTQQSAEKFSCVAMLPALSCRPSCAQDGDGNLDGSHETDPIKKTLEKITDQVCLPFHPNRIRILLS